MSTFSPSGVIRISTNYVPAEGHGASISPATYAGDEKAGRPAGAAWTESTPMRTLDAEGNIVLGESKSSVIIDSQASQTTRAENSLWELRDELSLPGIVVSEPETDVLKDVFEAAFARAVKAGKISANYDKETLMADYLTRLNFKSSSISSWTLPHRHIDGLIRIATTDSSGNTSKEVWKEKGELYNKLISASPQQLKTLMTLSPNSLLYGFWLSSGAPLLHKVARSYSYDISGYGANKISYGSTKMSTLPTDASLRYVENKEGELVEGNSGKRASEMLLGSVPSFSTKNVTAESILGSGAITSGALWANVNKDSSVGMEQKEAAFDALMHLGILGSMATLQQWDLRSGTSLIPEHTFFTEITPQGQKSLDFGTFDEFKLETLGAIQRAQELEIFGTAEDREVVYAGKSLATVSASAFLSGL